MQSFSPKQFFTDIFPFIVTAGEYSAAIQPSIAEHAAKEGKNIFATALSDADPGVQAFLEVVLLSRYPQFSYFSEEQDQSLNKKYFPVDAPYEVLLDPIDGTRAYLDKTDFYRIIIGLHDRSALAGALVYLPRLRRAYMAVRGGGAFLSEQGLDWRPFQIDWKGGPVLVADNKSIEAKLKRKFELFDFVSAYKTDPAVAAGVTIFDGTATAQLLEPVQGIDGGAIALIAQEAGAIVTDYNGEPLGNYRASPIRVVPNAVIASSADVHGALVRYLRAR